MNQLKELTQTNTLPGFTCCRCCLRLKGFSETNSLSAIPAKQVPPSLFIAPAHFSEPLSLYEFLHEHRFLIAGLVTLVSVTAGWLLWLHYGI